MSLVVRLAINDGPAIAFVVVRRMTGDTNPDSINVYEWYLSQAVPYIECRGTVEHRYGDGAVALLAKVMAAYYEMAESVSVGGNERK